jgi:hypothetical protein
MGNRDIKDAEPRLQKAWAFVLANFVKAYPDFPKFILSEVYRSPDLQRAYYAQGREPVARVNSQRRLVGLGPISEDENRKKVTNSKPGQSKHQQSPSKAIDILFVIGKTIVQDERYYKAMANMIRTFDPTITWGADWNRNGKTTDERFIDMPHFEV